MDGINALNYILDNNIEESADLYVYRVAEYKAIQIGKVSRLLKETAVDCIINQEQTNFTQEQLNNGKDTKQKLKFDFFITHRFNVIIGNYYIDDKTSSFDIVKGWYLKLKEKLTLKHLKS